MSETFGGFETIAIGLAVAGVLVAYAIHVVHMFRRGGGKLVAYLDGRAAAQRAALLKGEPALAKRVAGALCIAAMMAILAYAFARKIQFI